MTLRTGDFVADLMDMKRHHPRCFETQVFCGVFCFVLGVFLTALFLKVL